MKVLWGYQVRAEIGGFEFGRAGVEAQGDSHLLEGAHQSKLVLAFNIIVATAVFEAEYAFTYVGR